MPATVKANLKPEPGKDKTHAVRIRVYTEQPARYYDTGIRILKGQWNLKATYEKENWIKNDHPEHSTYNLEISKLVAAFKKLALNNPYANASEIISLHTNPPENNKGKGFVAFCREWVNRKRELKQYSAVNVYGQALDRYLEFTGPNPPDAKFLHTHQISKFLLWLRKDQEYALKTANDTISNLNTIYKAGVLEGWINTYADPFGIPKLIEHEEEIERPTAEQMLSLMHLENLEPRLLHARNIVLMLFFMAGARISEALDLEWQKNVKPEYIEWLPKKRAKKLKRVKRHAGIAWVLNQYPQTGKHIFPYITAEDLQLGKTDPEAYFKKRKGYNSAINKRFKRVAKLAGIEMNVSTKMLRQAYTGEAINASDIRMAQKGVGHASVITTEIYDKEPMQRQIDEMNDKIFSKIPVK